ncbi:MAG: hypothetical protein Q9224_005891, partial [Gallowayella concinna]
RTTALAGVAAKAIQSTCDSCRHSLVWEVSTFLQQYNDLLLWEDLETVAKERIIGAIAAIVQAVPSPEDKIESISKLLDFVEQDVQMCLEFAENNAPVGAEEKGLCALSCLISMGKYLEEPDDKTIDLEFQPPGQDELYMPTIWTPAQQRMAQNMDAVGKALGTNNGAVVEAICQVFRTGFKEKFPGPFVFGPNVVENYITSTNLRTPRLDYALSTAGAMLSAHTRAGTTMINRSATSILELYGPQITQVIINNIGGDASRSELVNFADPLRQMVSQQVTARKWLSDALSNRNFPSTKVGDAEKRMFLQQVLK